MALDEQLISRNNQENRDAAGPEGDADFSDNNDFNAQKYQTRNSGLDSDGLPVAGGSGDIRADLMAKKRFREQAANKLEGKEGKVIEASGANKATSELLKSAWKSLIPSWGLSLIWIDIHIFLSQVLGKDLFCSLGEEWFPKGTPRNIDGAKKSVGMTEGMAVGCLNIGCLLLILGVLALVSMIVTGLTNPLEAIKNIFGSLWCVLGSCPK